MIKEVPVQVSSNTKRSGIGSSVLAPVSIVWIVDPSPIIAVGISDQHDVPLKAGQEVGVGGSVGGQLVNHPGADTVGDPFTSMNVYLFKV